MRTRLCPLIACAMSLLTVTLIAQQQTREEIRFTLKVLEGEDAVNIISRKTAVAPVVEITDRNHLPIAGVPVVFWITSGNASFAGGAGQVTILTDATGRAVPSGLIPTAQGTLRIDVVATVDGHTTTTSITQTNVVTPPKQQTESERNDSSAGHSSAAGGGLGMKSWLAIAGGAAAAMALVASKAGQTPCSNYLNAPDSSAIPGSGSTLRFTVIVTPPDCTDYAWTTSTSSAGVTINPTNGVGTRDVAVVIAPNPSNSAERSLSFVIAGTPFTYTQRANLPPCNSQQVAGGNAAETRTIEMGRNVGTFDFVYDTQNVPDRMIVSYAGRTLFDTGCVGTNGARTQPISYSGSTSAVSVMVTPNCSGTGSTAWSFVVTCPR